MILLTRSLVICKSRTQVDRERVNGKQHFMKAKEAESNTDLASPINKRQLTCFLDFQMRVT